MTAYLFVTIRIHDPSWIAEYQSNVPGIVHKHGGALHAISETVLRCEGDGPAPDRAVMLSFPSMQAIEDFVSDPEYQHYRAARLAGSSSDAIAFLSTGP